MIRRRARCTGLLVLALTARPVLGQEGPILSAPPEHPDASATYLIYLHGAIIETQGRRPTSPQFGVYEYDAVLEALSGPGRIVISEQRPANTVVSEYAKVVVGQVEGLIDQGVPPSHIAVVGFSKGGKIAIAASALLGAPITYVLLAACNTDVDDAYQVHGRILSIYEESDVIGRPCQPLFDHSPDRIEGNRDLDRSEARSVLPAAGGVGGRRDRVGGGDGRLAPNPERRYRAAGTARRGER